MSTFIEPHDVIKIYTGISLAVLISIAAPPLLIYLVILGLGYWHTVVKKNASYLLLALTVNKYLTIGIGVILMIVGVIGGLSILFESHAEELGSKFVELLVSGVVSGIFCIAVFYGAFYVFKLLITNPILRNLEYITHHGIFKNYIGKLIPQSPKVTKKSQSDELSYWFDLFKQGAITQKEYEDKKNRILQSSNKQPMRTGKKKKKKD